MEVYYNCLYKFIISYLCWRERSITNLFIVINLCYQPLDQWTTDFSVFMILVLNQSCYKFIMVFKMWCIWRFCIQFRWRIHCGVMGVCFLVGSFSFKRINFLLCFKKQEIMAVKMSNFNEGLNFFTILIDYLVEWTPNYRKVKKKLEKQSWSLMKLHSTHAEVYEEGGACYTKHKGTSKRH